ncbi:IS66 family insertion sequence element accessory protein TnpA, partial [Marinomonas arctica]
MNTNTILNQTWAAHIEKWRSSGLSAKAFCVRISVIANACFGLFRTPGPALFLFPYFYSKCSDCA